MVVPRTAAPSRGASSLLLAVAVLVLAALVATVSAAQFKVTAILPMTSFDAGVTSQFAAEALQVVQTQVNQLASAGNGNHSFTLDIKDSQGSMSTSVKSVFDAANGGSVGIIGEVMSAETIPMALASNNFNMWMCSGSATSPTLSKKSDYQYFFRTIPADDVQGAFLAKFVQLMTWQSAAVIFSSDSYGTGVMTTFSEAASKIDGFKVTTMQSYTPGGTPADYSVVLNSVLNSGTRVVVFMGMSSDFIVMLAEAKKLGMVGDQWVWIGSDAISDLIERMWGKDNKYTDADRSNVDGVMFAFPNEQGPQYNDFLSAYKAKFPQRSEIGHYASLFADCYLAIARGILKLAGSQSPESINKRQYGSGISLKDFLAPFDGISGKINFDDHGDRTADYQVQNVYKGKLTTVYKYTDGANALTKVADPKFYSGKSDIPKDRPSFMEAYVRYTSAGGLIVMGITAILIIMVLGTTAYLYVQRDHSAVKSMALPFLVQIAVGLVLVLATVFLWIDIPSQMTCNLQAWLFVFGLELVLSAVAAKAFRIWKVFDNRALQKLNHLSNTRLFLGCFVIVLIQSAIMAAWTMLAPLQPTQVSTASSVSYKCASKSTSLDTIFQTVSLLYNTVLLLVVTFLAFKTRKAFSAFREAKFIAYTCQNIFISGVVVVPFLYLSTESFALAAFYIKTFVLLYATAFAYVCLLARIALVPYMNSKKANETGMKMSIEGGSSNDGTSSAEHVPGKPQTMQGKYPVKVANKLFETWHTNRITLFALEGFLGITRLTNNTEQGKLFKLRSLQFDPSPASYPLCLELRADSSAWLIQFSKEEDKQKWVRALSVHCLVYSKSNSASKSTGGGTTPSNMRMTTGGPNGASYTLSAVHYGDGARSNIGATSMGGGPPRKMHDITPNLK
ncbi:hypothetical protein GGF31_009019 [Allomyces arbusculus]|nr:hypothetical protein GGF31_009019 [Allomyces arbusculus]